MTRKENWRTSRSDGIWRRANDLVEELWEKGDVSALHVLVGNSKEIVWQKNPGEKTPGFDQVFDLASLTKPVVASLALRLDLIGALPLALRIGSIWPEAPDYLARRSLSSLLRHRSGLPAWLPIYHLCEGPRQAPVATLKSCREPTKPGTYSDLGYLLWGWTAERVLKRSLQEILEEELLGTLDTQAWPARPGASPEVALSHLDTSKEVELASAQGLDIEVMPAPERGEAQDGNARFLGGVCGHAGLFGTAKGLWRLAAEWLRPNRLLDESSVLRALGGRGPFALGWSRRRLANSGGSGLSHRAFGHVGFTGGSYWVDPDRDLVIISLAHRKSLTVDLLPWRQSLHRAITGA